MTLADLIVRKTKFTEEAIKTIISPYVRYDIDELNIVFTPIANVLAKKNKVLVYLVAMQGWQFIHDEVIEVEQTPKQLSESLDIQGPTLRPILKDLKDRNLIAEKRRKYSVRYVTLEEIMAELDGAPRTATRRLPTMTQMNKPRAISQSTVETTKKTPNLRQTGKDLRRKSNTSAQGTSDAIYKLIEEGFFDDGKTSADLRGQLHEQAVMVKPTSLPPYLVSLVRTDQLVRKKEEVDGKFVWVYRTTKRGEATS